MYDKPIIDERLLASGGMAVVQLLVSADRFLWLLCQQDAGEDRRALLYRVDLEQQRSILMMEKVGTTALACSFVDPKRGWVLYAVPGEGVGRVHILGTENGGHTWAEGAVLDGMGQPAVAAITADDLLAYNREGGAFHSMDGGSSFEPVAVGGRIIACQAASPGIVYALLENGLAKSTDGGQTWVTLDALVHGVEVSGTAMDFRGERVGIVYGEDRLFMTTDGGQSWEVLVYPYDYVFD